jgi:hypothetical protein
MPIIAKDYYQIDIQMFLIFVKISKTHLFLTLLLRINVELPSGLQLVIIR